MSNSMTEQVRAMSDQELFRFFTGMQVYKNPELTLAVCQEVENREAAKAGRKPAVVSFENLGDGRTRGLSDPDGKIILNFLYLKPGMSGTLPPAMLLNTLLHEGRHQWQIKAENDPDVPESIRLMLNVDKYCYVNSDESSIDIGIRPKEVQTRIQYAMQENEIDARFYAIRRMQEIAKTMVPDSAFRNQLLRAQNDEVRDIRRLLSYCSEEQYQLLEKGRLEKYRQLAESYRKAGYTLPELPGNFRCYGNIWMIRNIVAPVTGFLLQRMSLAHRLTGAGDRLLYRLYEITRVFAMKGRPLEKPEELLTVAIQEGLAKEFGLSEIKATEKIEKPIKM